MKWQKRRDAFARLVKVAILMVVAVGGGWIVAGYYGLVTIPGLTIPERVRSYVPPPAALPGPTPQDGIMSHVLVIDYWPTLGDAVAITEALQSRLPNLIFFVTPLDVDGTLRYELYVGPAYSAIEAAALKEPVFAANPREDPDNWSVREAPYAFLFGEYETVVNAEGRVQALARASIPAYALQVSYPDSTTRVRVYGGAFWDEFEAEQMGRMVNDAEVGELVLTPRWGIVPE